MEVALYFYSLKRALGRTILKRAWFRVAAEDFSYRYGDDSGLDDRAWSRGWGGESVVKETN